MPKGRQECGRRLTGAVLAAGLVLAPLPAVGQGPDEGALLVRACLPCHQLEPGAAARPGPPLWDVYGRAKGSVAGYRYSEALSRAGGVWDAAALDAYLAAPARAIPGTSMVFPGIERDDDRAQLIAYLARLAAAAAMGTSTPVPSATR